MSEDEYIRNNDILFGGFTVKKASDEKLKVDTHLAVPGGSSDVAISVGSIVGLLFIYVVAVRCCEFKRIFGAIFKRHF